MSVAKRLDGSYRARVVGLDGKEHSRHFRTSKEAHAWEAQQKAAKIKGDWVDENGKITFMQFFEEWASRQLWESGTVKAMNLSARSAAGTFGRTPIVKLRRAHVELWVKEMTVAGLAPGTIKTRIGNLRNILRAAVRERAIARDVSEGVVLPRRRRQEHSLRLPSEDELRLILKAAEPHYRAFVALGAFAGMRLGEVAALRPVDIDFGTGAIHVTQQIQRTSKSQTELRAPKFGSERKVYMAKRLAVILRVHIATYRITPEGWMFPGEGIYPLHQNSSGYLWRKACRLAGVENVRYHDLRHYFASQLIYAGCDIVTVAKALGHSSIQTTLSTYAHLMPSAEDRTRSAAQGMMDAIYGDDDEDNPGLVAVAA